MIEKAPNPGSPEAVKRGCTCPTMDNWHGEGQPATNWIVANDCPIHAVLEETEMTTDEALKEIADLKMAMIDGFWELLDQAEQAVIGDFELTKEELSTTASVMKVGVLALSAKARDDLKIWTDEIQDEIIKLERSLRVKRGDS